MKENTDYEMIAGTGENWDIRIPHPTPRRV